MAINEPHGAFSTGTWHAVRNTLIVPALLFAVGVVATITSMNVSADSSTSDLGCVDNNLNGLVDIPELFDVIEAYFDGTVSSNLGCVDSNDNGLVDISELFDVIEAYFDGTPIGPEPTDRFGPGTLRVGEDIAPGIYAGRAGTDILNSCYWARLEGASGDLDDILANEIARGQFYLEVLETDAYLEIDCEITPLSDWPVPSPRLTTLDPGMYIVGRDIDAGTYRGEAGEDISSWCYWERLSGVTGDFAQLIANDIAKGPFYVEVEVSDFALATDCELELSP